MLSKFDCVNYDKQAASEQNELRINFKHYEKGLEKGDVVQVATMVFPEGEYHPICETVRRLLLENPEERLHCLEILYFLTGKEIRRTCMERLGLK